MSAILFQCPQCFRWGPRAHDCMVDASNGQPLTDAGPPDVTPDSLRPKFEVCPGCGGSSFEETCIGWIGGARNPNKRTCSTCRARWYAPEMVLGSSREVPK